MRILMQFSQIQAKIDAICEKDVGDIKLVLLQIQCLVYQCFFLQEICSRETFREKNSLKASRARSPGSRDWVLEALRSRSLGRQSLVALEHITLCSYRAKGIFQSIFLQGFLQIRSIDQYCNESSVYFCIVLKSRSISSFKYLVESSIQIYYQR